MLKHFFQFFPGFLRRAYGAGASGQSRLTNPSKSHTFEDPSRIGRTVSCRLSVLKHFFKVFSRFQRRAYGAGASGQSRLTNPSKSFTFEDPSRIGRTVSTESCAMSTIEPDFTLPSARGASGQLRNANPSKIPYTRRPIPLAMTMSNVCAQAFFF